MTFRTEDPLSWIECEMRRLQRGNLERRLRVVKREAGGIAHLSKKAFVDLSSNDYLGVASDEVLLSTFLRQAEGTDRFGCLGMGSGGSRLLTGHSPACEALEAELPPWCGKEAALVFSSGMHANMGTIPALVGPGDAVFSDALNHASLVDGCRLSRARIEVYRHLDLNDLEARLAFRRPVKGRALIVTESLFSMDGDSPDLHALVGLKERYGAMLMVDEAHSVGVFGPRGEGICAGSRVSGRVDLLVGTFGKAFGSTGAFIACDTPLKRYLVNSARTLIYTTAPPPVALQWTRFILVRIPGFQDRRERLLSTAGRLRSALHEEGISTGGCSQIVPVFLGENQAACRAAGLLRASGYLAFPIRPPTVPEGTARLRLSLTAALSWQALRILPGLLGRAAGERS